MKAQLALMDDRPDNCPPWYCATPFISKTFTDYIVLIAYYQLSLADNILIVINTMANAHVHRDSVAMIVFNLVRQALYMG